MSCQVGIEPDGMGVQMGLGKGLEVEVEVGSEQEGGPDGIETADCSVLAPCQTISLERAKNNIMTMDVSNELLELFSSYNEQEILTIHLNILI